MCRLFKVTGRVQGVFFRASTQEVAERFGLKGHAINLPDGSVEVRACGADQFVNDLAEWLHEGPRMAAVSGVSESESQCEGPVAFTIG